LSNHSSYLGTKWLHCRIFNVFGWALAREGWLSGANPANASDPTPTVFSNSRLEIEALRCNAIVTPL
jgi:hypothetical protein